MVISLLIPVLTDYAETLTEGGDVLSARAREFSPVALWGGEYDHLEAALEEQGRVVVSRVGSEEEARRGLEEGRFSMVLGPSSGDSGVLDVVLNRADPRSVSAWTAFEVIADVQQIRVQRERIEAEIARMVELEGNLTEAEARYLARNLSDLYIEPIQMEVSEVGRGAPAAPAAPFANGNGSSTPIPDGGKGGARVTPVTSSSFLSLVFVSLGLCFPLLSGSGMMIESITGEKEQRTIEGLLGSSISRGSILMGKFSAAFVVAAVQSIALVLILSAVMEIHNVFSVVLCLLAVAVAVLSATTMVSVVSKTMKEANLAITILYVLVFVLFFGPLMLPGPAAWISPFTPVVRLAAGDAMPVSSALAPLVASVIFGCLCLLICSALFSRDDVVFGPRPSFRGLLSDLVSSRVRGRAGMALLAAGSGALATIPAMLLPGMFLLPSVAIVGRWGFLVAFAGAALVEEYFKPYGIYLLGDGIGRHRMIALGALSGLSFSVVENLLFTLALSGTGYLQGWVLLARYLLAPALHMGLSCIVVAGYTSGRRNWAAALFIASCVHASYNLAALMAVV